jgi:DNA processing protein
VTSGSAFRGVRLDDDQRIAWLRLIRSENVGPATFRSLVNHFGSAQAALDALPDLARRGGAARRPRIPTVAEAEREVSSVAAAGARLVAIGEPDYPRHLREIPAPPPLVTVRGGDTALFQRVAVAIVGSRNASVAGTRMADRIARGLGDAGCVVVSGLARGIDAAAHRASIETGTVAVIAGGIGHVYPEEHGPLIEEIVGRGGAVLSEMPCGWIPRAQDFPRRNRIVSGMSLGVVVVEAAARSGTLHTARFALEQGREVFAVPGSPLDPRAEGTNRLIRDGAGLVTSAADVLEVLAAQMDRAVRSDLGAEDPAAGDGVVPDIDDAARAAVADAIGWVPTAIDDVILHSGLPARIVTVVLLELELAGRLERHGNQLVSLTG